MQVIPKLVQIFVISASCTGCDNGFVQVFALCKLLLRVIPKLVLVFIISAMQVVPKLVHAFVLVQVALDAITGVPVLIELYIFSYECFFFTLRLLCSLCSHVIIKDQFEINEFVFRSIFGGTKPTKLKQKNAHEQNSIDLISIISTVLKRRISWA